VSGEILLSLSEEEPSEPYYEALAAAGAAADTIRVVGPADRADCRSLARRAGGVVLGGGCDVEPRRFGEEPQADAGLKLLPERDEVEWELLAGASEGRAPVWGICRGLQVLNAYFGGSLHQDLRPAEHSGVNHNVPHPRDATVHAVQVTSTLSVLGDLLAQQPVPVNSRHHQGIKVLAQGLVAVASSSDGLVEAVSWHHASWWVHAVQWHPENLVHLEQHRVLWEAFITATVVRQSY
jgi:putative glutamine amidotransferase